MLTSRRGKGKSMKRYLKKKKKNVIDPALVSCNLPHWFGLTDNSWLSRPKCMLKLKQRSSKRRFAEAKSSRRPAHSLDSVD